jgi:hypothetical protein
MNGLIFLTRTKMPGTALLSGLHFEPITKIPYTRPSQVNGEPESPYSKKDQSTKLLGSEVMPKNTH